MRAIPTFCGQLVEVLHAAMASMALINLPQTPAARQHLQGGVEQSWQQSVGIALVEVADLVEFVTNPTGIHLVFELLEFLFTEIVFQQTFKCSLGCQHSALDGQMNALQALRIHEARRVTYDHPSMAGKTRYGVPAAIRQSLGTISNHLSAFQQMSDKTMFLELLQ